MQGFKKIFVEVRCKRTVTLIVLVQPDFIGTNCNELLGNRFIIFERNFYKSIAARRNAQGKNNRVAVEIFDERLLVLLQFLFYTSKRVNKIIVFVLVVSRIFLFERFCESFPIVLRC